MSIPKYEKNQVENTCSIPREKHLSVPAKNLLNDRGLDMAGQSVHSEDGRPPLFGNNRTIFFNVGQTFRAEITASQNTGCYQVVPVGRSSVLHLDVQGVAIPFTLPRDHLIRIRDEESGFSSFEFGVDFERGFAVSVHEGLLDFGDVVVQGEVVRIGRSQVTLILEQNEEARLGGVKGQNDLASLFIHNIGTQDAVVNIRDAYVGNGLKSSLKSLTPSSVASQLEVEIQETDLSQQKSQNKNVRGCYRGARGRALPPSQRRCQRTK